MKDPMVSVVVCTYQHANFIRQSLDSILNQQTNFDFEIILGEDESTDGTREICIDYADKYPEKIRLFLRSRTDVIYINGSATGRYNLIENLKAAKGKYIALCEGDDYWTDPLKLQNQVDFLEFNTNYVISGHDVICVDSNNNELKIKRLGKDRKQDFTGTELKSGRHVVTLTMMFKNIITNFPEELYRSYSADTFLVSLLGAYGDYKFHEEIQPAVYRIHQGGVWSSLDEIKQRSGQRSTYRYMVKYYNRVGDKRTARQLLKKYVNISKTLLGLLKTKKKYKKMTKIYINTSIFTLRNNDILTALRLSKFYIKQLKHRS